MIPNPVVMDDHVSPASRFLQMLCWFWRRHSTRNPKRIYLKMPLIPSHPNSSFQFSLPKIHVDTNLNFLCSPICFWFSQPPQKQIHLYSNYKPENILGPLHRKKKKTTRNLASLFIAHFHLSILPASDEFWHLYWGFFKDGYGGGCCYKNEKTWNDNY